MTRSFRICPFPAASLVIISVALTLPASEPDSLALRLQLKLDRVVAVKGRFVQRLDSASLGHPRSEKGRFFLKKPSMMRWEYEEPERKLAITDGVVTWFYLPAEKEVHRGRVQGSEGTGAASMLLSGGLRIDRDFTVRTLAADDPDTAMAAGHAGVEVLELLPRRGREEFDRVLLTVDPRELQIRRFTLIDALGDRMIFELHDLEENVDLADELFRFAPPAGVEIIELR